MSRFMFPEHLRVIGTLERVRQSRSGVRYLLFLKRRGIRMNRIPLATFFTLR